MSAQSFDAVSPDGTLSDLTRHRCHFYVLSCDSIVADV